MEAASGPGIDAKERLPRSAECVRAGEGGGERGRRRGAHPGRTPRRAPGAAAPPAP